jgi:hypothetical protein
VELLGGRERLSRASGAVSIAVGQG